MKGQRIRRKTCVLISLLRQLFFLVNCRVFFNDNSDNSDNGKNERNTLCHEVTYNWDNEITVANLIFFASSRKLLVKLVNRTESQFREKRCIPYLVL